jgi:pyruvate ferredoxin oxidoreductase delta subunit
LKIKPNAGWRELPQGGIIDEGGTAAEFKTGDWRAMRPIWSEEKCIHCLACWINCPDSAIIVKDQKCLGPDLDFCKGCGICAQVCPPKVTAITMVREGEEA